MTRLKAFLSCILSAAAFGLQAQSARPPIAVNFNLKEAGYVTLVIEDGNGQRVRNLVSDTFFKGGNNTVWWDGLNDLGRDLDAAHHGVYAVPPALVAPGKYTVRGLLHQQVKTAYQLSVYANGNPPWDTKDHTGAWLANHTPPQAAAFVPAELSPGKQPAVFLGAYITEGPDGLIWVDLDGKKMGGKTWVGGVWTAAPYMARDGGKVALPGISVYVASVWETSGNSGQGTVRISALPKNADKPVFLYPTGPLIHEAGAIMSEIGGFAVYNGIGVVSLTKKNQLVFTDLKNGKALGTLIVENPHAALFDKKGSLLLLSGNKLLRYERAADPAHPEPASVLISSQLEAPVGITQDAAGRLYISNGGTSHQVKVFTAEGKFLYAIGKPGAPAAGMYDPLHMNNPAGMAIDSRSQLWVTENDYLPKRVSVWTLDGKFIRAFYGPAKYGGGGTIDPQDKTRFYYAEQDLGSMEFKIDWKSGKSELHSILYRKTPGKMSLPARIAAPETAIYYKGKRYFTNCYNSNPTGAPATAFLFVERNGKLQPAAAMGSAESWGLLKESRFIPSWPTGVDLNSKGQNSQAFFIWNDLNEDAAVQPEELSFQKGAASGVTVMDDLSFCITRLKGAAVQFSPVSFTAAGVPVYSITQGKVLAEGVQPPGSSGGDQVLAAGGGWTVVTQGILPFERYSLSGAKNGKPVWSYPNLWPGLHAGHEAPLPLFTGELIAPTRLLGGLLHIKGVEGALWALNSNHGMIYIFTADGLFVTTLFEPMRTGRRWDMPVAQRGMSLKGLTLGEENFWPGMTVTAAGEVYLVDGAGSSIVSVEGLQTLRRLPPVSIVVTTDDLKKSAAFQGRAEMARQKSMIRPVLKVAVSNTPIAVDGNLEDWKNTDWAEIDKRGVKANFNSNAKPYHVSAAIAVSNGKLYAAWRTGDAALLRNSFEMPLAPFKTGGALDLMIGTSASGADQKRTAPVAGDLRLLVTLSRGKAHALLYRAVVAGVKGADKVPFSSPWRTVTFDRVDDVSDQLEFAAGKDGAFELALPLSTLNMMPVPGTLIRGDIGIIRGDGSRTISRVYWNNKATSIISDVPSEAELSPGLWGTWQFETR
ncbi:hypothetical protein SAMN06265348_10491 [Pedobacter westerhofensis]|uniref:NHL repeat-containing protein n=1 Tax=Pedobacter westerhofensis TaxID=425512 RepID=A0A521CP78_9SPHI|nr:hypothetical protein [Pedobacter westerhofensis]SMO61259.1 hypothetical protein SAMN06265348_10491 [Pedobacter westerhofensis]